MTSPDRSTYIGSTDTAALLGLSPWAGKHHVYMKLLGMKVEKPMSFEMWYGLEHEALAAKVYEKHYGKKVVGTQKFFTHPAYPWLGGHVDGLVLHDEHQDYQLSAEDPTEVVTSVVERGVEFKTSNPRNIREWGDGPNEYPEHYGIQCQHFMMLTGIKVWDLCISIGNFWRRYSIQSDTAICATILKAAEECWNEVARLRELRSTDPGAFALEMATIAATDEEARKLIATTIYPYAKTECVPVPEQHGQMADILISKKIELSKLEDEYEHFCNDAKIAMGETKKWECQSGTIEWRNQGKGRAFVVKPID